MFFLPIYGDRAVPPTVKLLFGLAFAFVAFPMLMGSGVGVPPAVLESPSKTAWAVCTEIGFGLMVAFCARWVFDAIQFAGHFAGTSMGFSMASVLDPHTETQTIAVAELHYIMAGLLFLSLDGHHVYLSAILQSFRIVPLATADLLAHGDGVIQYLIHMTGEVISLGLKLSAPVVVVSLILNLTFGVLARAVPQMNVMAVSFTANIMIGLLVAFINLPGFMNAVNGSFDAFTPELVRFMRLFHG
ncbi:MAG: flagellar biosynthetic protein FliR [Deltaproteobacteria bacterium]|nr:flagellar biosynthetic protein FliR [Deltaproteobacteria bacterium]